MFEQLGGIRAFDMACGNAETFSTETDFEKWKETLWTELFKIYAEQGTPEQAQAALVKRSTTLERRKSLKGNKNALPWLLNESEVAESELIADPNAPQPAYDLNMRNYSNKSVACPIKTIR